MEKEVKSADVPSDSDSFDGLCYFDVENKVTVATESEEWVEMEKNNDSQSVEDTSSLV